MQGTVLGIVVASEPIEVASAVLDMMVDGIDVAVGVAGQ